MQKARLAAPPTRGLPSRTALQSRLRAHLRAIACPVLLVTLSASAQTTAPAPTTAPSTSPAASAWLDQLQAHSASVKSFEAGIVYLRIQELQGDRQTRFGKLWYVPGPPPRFDIHIESRLIDDRKEDQSEWFIFDGQWLLNKIDSEKHAWKRQLVAPNAPPDKADPLGRGEGPFPLPVTLDKARVLKRYSAELIPPAAGDPPNTVHLRLKPLNADHARFTQLDFWHDKTTLLPVRIRTQDDSENQSVVNIKDAKVNQPIDPKVFATTTPAQGWEVEITPWEEKP